MLRNLFNWIKSLFSSAPKAEENYSLYKPSERLIYQYFDGKQIVHADPITLYKRLADVGTDLSMDIIESESPMKGAAEAREKVLTKIKWIFSVKSYEDGGLTFVELYGLFEHFMLYTQQIKKNLKRSPTQSAAQEDSTSSRVGNPPSTNSSVSGSTGKEVSTEQQTQSTSEQASHSESPLPPNFGNQSRTESAKQSCSNPSSNPDTTDKRND